MSVDVLYVPSIVDWNRESWRLLVEKRIAKAAKNFGLWLWLLALVTGYRLQVTSIR